MNATNLTVVRKKQPNEGILILQWIYSCWHINGNAVRRALMICLKSLVLMLQLENTLYLFIYLLKNNAACNYLLNNEIALI